MIQMKKTERGERLENGENEEEEGVEEIYVNQPEIQIYLLLTAGPYNKLIW